MLNISGISIYDNFGLISNGSNNIAAEATEKLPNFDTAPSFDVSSAGNPREKSGRDKDQQT